MFVPIRDATIIAETNAAQIRQWARRGKVVVCCNRKTRHIEYEIASLIKAEETTRRRRESLTTAA